MGGIWSHILGKGRRMQFGKSDCSTSVQSKPRKNSSTNAENYVAILSGTYLTPIKRHRNARMIIHTWSFKISSHPTTAFRRNICYEVVLDEPEGYIMAPGDTEAKLSTWELGEALYHSRSVFDPGNRILLSAAIGMRTPYSDLAELFEINNHNISLRLFRPEKS